MVTGDISIMFTVQNVSKSFKQGENTVHLFQDSSYFFESGKSYAVMGPSGSGKSTLLYMLMGIEQPTAGSVLLHRENIVEMSQEKKDSLRRSLGIMFQQPYLISELTVLENVMLKAILHETITEKDKQRARDLLCAVGLADKEHVMPLTLSGGEQQRVALLRALFYPPEWLLVDEPTGSLDQQSGQEILLLLKQYQSVYNMGIIMSTHDIKIAENMDVIVHIEDKKLKKT